MKVLDCKYQRKIITKEMILDRLKITVQPQMDADIFLLLYKRQRAKGVRLKVIKFIINLIKTSKNEYF